MHVTQVNKLISISMMQISILGIDLLIYQLHVIMFFKLQILFYNQINVVPPPPALAGPQHSSSKSPP